MCNKYFTKGGVFAKRVVLHSSSNFEIFDSFSNAFNIIESHFKRFAIFEVSESNKLKIATMIEL